MPNTLTSYIMNFKIGDVLGGNIAHDANVLYAPKIDKEAFLTALRNLKKNVSETVQKSDEKIHTIDEGLAATNSQRFYKNATATKQVSNLNEMSKNMGDLMRLLGNISEDQISGVIDRYNSSLVGIKKTTRKELLEKAASKVNGHKLIKTEITKKFYDDDDNHSYYHEEKNGTTKVITRRYETDITNDLGRKQYITKIETYTWIQCAEDPHVTEGRFTEMGVDLPYNPNQIVDINL